MAGAAVALRQNLQPDGVLVAVDARLDHLLDLAARGALMPELPARAAEVVRLAGLERLGEARNSRYDLVLADADAWDAEALTTALQTLAGQAGAAPVQTIAYNTSGSQAMHFGDQVGSLSVVGYIGSSGGHLISN